MKKHENLLRKIALVALFIIPFVPLVVCSSLFFPFVVGKNILFRVMTEIAVGSWAILALFKKEYRPKFSGILASILVLLAVMFMADLLSENPLKSFWSNFERMEGWITLLHLLGYFIALVGVLHNQKIWTRYFNTSLWIGFGINLYGVLQLAGLATAVRGTSRLDSSFGNASYLAIYVLLHIFIASFLWLRRLEKKDFMGYFYGISILLNIYILYHTATRGAILGFIGAIFLVAALISLFEKENKKLRKIATASVLGVVLFVALFISAKDTNFVRQNPVLNRFASISLQEQTTKSRFMVWNMAWQGVKERPLLGWGQESFSYIFSENYNSKMYGQEEWFDRTHNVFMDWLVAGGFLALLSYLSLFFFILYYIWHGKYGKNFSLVEKSIFSAMLSGYFIHNLFVFDNITSYIMFFIILAFVHNSINREDDEEAPKSILDKISELNKEKVFVPILVVLTCFSLYFFNFEILRANRFLLKGLNPASGGLDKNYKYFEKALSYNSPMQQEVTEQLALFSTKINALNLSKEEKNKFFILSKDSLESMIEKDPSNLRNFVFLGSLLVNFGQYDEALEYLEKALKMSPNKQSIYFEVASVYLNQANYVKALEVFKKAYELEKNYGRARNLYALAAIYADDVQLEESLLQREIIADQNFLNAYKKKEQWDKVILVAEKILEGKPKDPQSYITLAAVYYEVGRSAEAIIQLEKAIELDPNFKVQGEEFIQAIQAKALEK